MSLIRDPVRNNKLHRPKMVGDFNIAKKLTIISMYFCSGPDAGLKENESMTRIKEHTSYCPVVGADEPLGSNFSERFPLLISCKIFPVNGNLKVFLFKCKRRPILTLP